MKAPAKFFVWGAAAVYPVAVFLGLVYFKVSPRILSLLLAVLGMGGFLSATSRRDGEGGKPAARFSVYLPAVVAAVLAAAVLVSDDAVFLKLYPLFITASFLGGFAFSLFRPPSMILRFALLADRSLASKPEFPKIERYCRNVTLVWIAFFCFNGAVAAYTIFFASNLAWSVYNGLVSYLLMGALFLGEMVVRRFLIAR